MSTWTYRVAGDSSMKSEDCFLSCCQVRDKRVTQRTMSSGLISITGYVKILSFTPPAPSET